MSPVPLHNRPASLPLPHGAEQEVDLELDMQLEVEVEVEIEAVLKTRLQHAVVELNKYLTKRRPDLHFTLSNKQGQPQVLIVDALSGIMLREMAVAEALRTARYLEHDRLGLVRQRS